MESELFGHDRGAFTGAMTAKAGWFETAEGGSLFLDEIGDLPLTLQAKFLRVIQEREVVRIGSRQPIAINVRLIAATNVKLDEAVAAGRFREDLYYRLHVATVNLPPLRERPGDILPLAHYFSRYTGPDWALQPPSCRSRSRRAIARLSMARQYPRTGKYDSPCVAGLPGTKCRPADLRLPSSRSHVRNRGKTADQSLVALKIPPQQLFQKNDLSSIN